MNRRFLLAPATCIALLSSLVVCVGDETDAPLPGVRAAIESRLPDGFQATLFAAEPDVRQPIGFCIDDRNRLWVAEAYSYPRHTDQNAKDRIVILEDTDGDGKHDKRTVFYEGLNYVTGIEKGFGGAWVMSPPYFYFIPDRDGDDVPDSKPQVLLDGFGNHDNAHNLANGFAWGPDGWLYGTHGRTNWSMIGTPGRKDKDRRRFDGGVYRYHPLTHVWEPYADGTTNPWGVDWNDYGHAFICNCVNPHLFQVIQGAHYEPWRGRKSSQYAYQRIDTVADHLHFTGLSDIRHGHGTAEEDAAGGGHAHCGTMIYLGDNFPQKYRNTLFTNNVHGRRINNDHPKRSGSGYIASHLPDLMRSADPWFMGVTLAYGSAGEVYVSDWSDTGECHSTRNTRKATGRVYQISYGELKKETVDVSTRTSLELAQLQLHRNDWWVRHARRLLQERFAAGEDLAAARARLFEIFANHNEVPRKLRALWTLHVTGGLEESFLSDALSHDSEDVRSWAITLLCESKRPSDSVLQRLAHLARSDSSPLVRLSITSALQRLEHSQRWEIVEALASHGEDAEDQNLPLMVWYAAEPLVTHDLERFADLSRQSQLSRIRINAARRMADAGEVERGLELLAAHLADEDVTAEVAEDMLDGILQGVEGKRTLVMPPAWRKAYDRLATIEKPELQDKIVRLAVMFNDQEALRRLRSIANDESESAGQRTRAIETLVDKRISGFDDDLILLIGDAAVRSAALRGLASYQSPGTANAILSLYASMDASDKQDAQMTLASRKSWAVSLLDAIEGKRVDATELTAFTARQIRAHGDDELSDRLAAQWGKVRETPKEKAKQISRLKKWLPKRIDEADLERGAALFKKQCGNCHKLFGEGGAIGPDITGAQRHNLDYMLENILDPSAAVAKDYQMESVLTVDGRVLTGLVVTEDEQTFKIQTVNELIVLPADDVERRTKSTVSIMPEGLLEPLGEEEIRDLMGYLRRTE